MTVKHFKNIIVANENQKEDDFYYLIEKEFTIALKKYFDVVPEYITTEYISIDNLSKKLISKKITKESIIINLGFIRSDKDKFEDILSNKITLKFLIRYLLADPSNKLVISEFMENINYTPLIKNYFPQQLHKQIYFLTSNIDIEQEEINIIHSQLFLPYALKIINNVDNTKLDITNNFQINANAVRGTKLIVMHMLKHFNLLQEGKYSYGKLVTPNLKKLVLNFYKNHKSIDLLKECFEHEINSTYINNVFGHTSDDSQKLYVGNKYFNFKLGKTYVDTYRKSLLGVVIEDNLTAHNDQCYVIPKTNFVTEKTYYNMYFKNPFIIFNNQHFFKNMKKLFGYKSFSPWIDESYDDIEDDIERYYTAIQELIKIQNMSDNDKKTFLQNVKPICEHNFNIMSETVKHKNYFQ